MKKHIVSTLVSAVCIGALAGAPALAAEGDWLVRGRVINVSPNDSTGPVSGIAGTEAGVDNDVVPELDFTYMLRKNIGVELILGTSKHQVTGTRGAVAGADVGTVRVLPPTLTLQYHFAPDAKVRPYAGIGVNYTYFYSAKAGAGLGSGASVKYKSSWGLAAQAGVDIDINNKWFLNLDVKYIDIDTTLTVTGGAVPGVTKVQIDPWVVGIGIGTRF